MYIQCISHVYYVYKSSDGEINLPRYVETWSNYNVGVCIIKTVSCPQNVICDAVTQLAVPNKGSKTYRLDSGVELFMGLLINSFKPSNFFNLSSIPFKVSSS